MVVGSALPGRGFPNSWEGIVTAEERLRRQAVRVARAMLGRALATVFIVVVSVAAGQVIDDVDQEVEALVI